MRFALFALCLLSLLLLPRPGACQETDFAAALSGTTRPLSFKLKDLDGIWRRVSVGTSGSLDVVTRLFTQQALGSALSSSSYTKGETQTIGGETYLIVYRHTPTAEEVSAMMTKAMGSSQGEMPLFASETPDTVLNLSLINIRQIISLDDVQVFTPPVKQARQNDQGTASLNNLKQIGLALTMYVQDYDEVLPPMKNAAVQKVLMPYVKNKAVFSSPQSKQPYQPNTSLSHRTLASFQNPSTMVVFYEAAPDAEGYRAVLFLDGHVERVDAAGWQKLKVASHVPNP